MAAGWSDTPALEQEAAGQRIGPYQPLERLGEAGFGTVWKAAREEPVRRMVALKILKPGMDTREVIARFEQERQALAVMEHPHIARVFDAGAAESGRPDFVMELVSGSRITEFCDAEKLSTAARLEVEVRVHSLVNENGEVEAPRELWAMVCGHL